MDGDSWLGCLLNDLLGTFRMKTLHYSNFQFPHHLSLKYLFIPVCGYMKIFSMVGELKSTNLIEVKTR